MRLKITDVNFTTIKDWLYKLADENGNDFYIMQEPFYKRHNIKSPITKRELDYNDKNQWITASVEQIDGKRVVISV